MNKNDAILLFGKKITSREAASMRAQRRLRGSARAEYDAHGKAHVWRGENIDRGEINS